MAATALDGGETRGGESCLLRGFTPTSSLTKHFTLGGARLIEPQTAGTGSLLARASSPGRPIPWEEGRFTIYPAVHTNPAPARPARVDESKEEEEEEEEEEEGGGGSARPTAKEP